MAAVRLEVKLDKEEPVFSCGEHVAGCVCIELSDDVETVGVELLAHGGCRILLHSDKERKANEPLTEEEVYIHDIYSLWGNPLSDTPDPDTETLERGRHFFPFSFSLPEDTPCSYEGVEGWVRYYLQARLLLAGSAPHTVIRQHITVLKDLDLSSEKVQEILMEEKENVPHVMCCHPGRLSCSIQIPKSAYVAGECINASVKISNTSMLRLKGVSVLLQQVVKTCPSEYKCHQRTNTIAQSLKKAVPPGYKGNTRALSVIVPPVPPSRLESCSLIDIHYFITLSIPLSPAPMNITIPVVIGTIPCLKGSACAFTMDLKEEACLKNQTSRPNEWTLSPSSYQLSSLQESSSVVYKPKYKTYTFEDQDELVLQQLTCSPKCFQKFKTEKQYFLLDPNTENVESIV